MAGWLRSECLRILEQADLQVGGFVDDDTVGADQILFGADYPHGRGGRDDQFYPMTLKEMELLDIPESDKEKIYSLNAKKLLGL